MGLTKSSVGVGAVDSGLEIKKLFEKCSILRVSVVLHYEERIKPPTAQRERFRKNRRRQKR